MLIQKPFKSNIEDGSYVIVKKIKGETLKVFKAGKNETTMIDNLSFRNSSVVGLKYEKIYEINNGKVVQHALKNDTVPFSSLQNTSNAESRKRTVVGEDEEEEPPSKIAGQSVTADEIGQLKASGASVEQVVTKLVIGNKNFNDRTTYSQAKYVSKKEKIHDSRVIFLRPDSRLLCLAYYQRYPEKINYLRFDVLANLLYNTNIVPGSKVLVYEECVGLVSGAILQKLDGKGELFIINNHGISSSHFPALYNYNLPSSICCTARPIRWQNFYRVLNGDYKSPTPCVDEPMDYESDELKEPSTPQQCTWIRERLFSTTGLDAVIFVGEQINAADFIKFVFKNIRLSGSIVTHSTIESDVVETVNALRTLPTVGIQTQSFMTRHIQAIQNCSHPLLNDVVTSGYIVSCIKVGE